MERYELLDHTADLGIRAFGRTVEEAFANAAFALFDQLTDLDRVEPGLDLPLRLEGADREDLLVRWLGELLFQSEAHGYLFKEFSISHLDQTSLVALARGERYDPSRHLLKTEIKAVTYHQVEVKENEGVFEASVIFDV